MNVPPPLPSNLRVSVLGYSVGPQDVPPASFHGGIQGFVPAFHEWIHPAPPAPVNIPLAPTVVPMVAPAMVVPAPDPAVVPAVPPAVAHTVAPVAVPVAVPGVAPPPALPVVAPSPCAKLLKLDPMKDAKAFLNPLEQIQFYLCMANFFTGHADESLTTDTTNQEASCVWEGQLCLAIKDGTLRFLFDSKESQYHGRGFKMLATLMCSIVVPILS